MSRPEFPEQPFGFPHSGARSMPGVLSEARRLAAVEALARQAMAAAGGGGTTYAARIRKSSNQSVGNNSQTVITWQTTEFDENSDMADLANNRLTAPVAGIYIVTAGGEWQANLSGQRQVSLLQNGSGFAWVTNAPSISTIWRMNVSGVVKLAAGDHIQLQAFQNSGGSLNMNNTDHTFLAMTKIG